MPPPPSLPWISPQNPNHHHPPTPHFSFILIQEWSHKAALSLVNYFQGRRNGFVPCCITSPMFPSSFIHACTVSCLAANLLTWHVNVQGVSSLQLCPFYTIRHQRLWRRRVGQHFAAVTQHCRRRVCSSPQWYINWLCSCNEITISVETTRL